MNSQEASTRDELDRLFNDATALYVGGHLTASLKLWQRARVLSEEWGDEASAR
ncbi:MAG: hypothetical protein M5U34_22505 [Chloroflexi bacterium]|nr:hypothetical protein [Chloroflexota bacterium]